MEQILVSNHQVNILNLEIHLLWDIVPRQIRLYKFCKLNRKIIIYLFKMITKKPNKIHMKVNKWTLICKINFTNKKF